MEGAEEEFEGEDDAGDDGEVVVDEDERAFEEEGGEEFEERVLGEEGEEEGAVPVVLVEEDFAPHVVFEFQVLPHELEQLAGESTHFPPID